MLHGRTIKLALSAPLALAALVSAVIGTLGIGSVVIHEAKGLLPSPIAAINPISSHVRVADRATPKHRTTKHVLGNQSSHSFGLQLVSDPVQSRTVRTPAVLVKRVAAQTRISPSTTTQSNGNTVPAGESAPHFEPIRSLLDGLGQLLSPKK
jgi:hypothetical protein